MEVIILIIIIWCVAMTYSTLNLLKKNERLEDEFSKMDNELSESIEFITKLEIDLNETFKLMKDVDSKGGFESDDEVGQVFKSINDSIKELEEKYGSKD